MIIADVVIEDFRVYSLIVSDSLLESIVTTTVSQTDRQKLVNTKREKTHNTPYSTQ